MGQSSRANLHSNPQASNVLCNLCMIIHYFLKFKNNLNNKIIIFSRDKIKSKQSEIVLILKSEID